MNRNTHERLVDFIDAVEELTAGVIHMIGVDSATKILAAAEELKGAIEKDETIP